MPKPASDLDRRIRPRLYSGIGQVHRICTQCRGTGEVQVVVRTDPPHGANMGRSPVYGWLRCSGCAGTGELHG